VCFCFDGFWVVLFGVGELCDMLGECDCGCCGECVFEFCDY